jgi:hypothetical protein
VSVLLQFIRTVDLVIYHFLNGFAGNRFLVYFANFEENNSLLKGGLFLALYCLLWFRVDSGQERRRRAIVAILVASILALVVSRTVANLAP